MSYKDIFNEKFEDFEKENGREPTHQEMEKLMCEYLSDLRECY